MKMELYTPDPAQVDGHGFGLSGHDYFMPSGGVRAPSISVVVAASALLGAVLQMCAEGNAGAAGAIPQEDEPVVEFTKLVELGTRVWHRVPDMLSKAQDAYDEDDEDAGGEEAGLSILAMRGASDNPVRTDLCALAAVVAAYGAYGSDGRDRGPLFGCLASTVCRRLLLSLNDREDKHFGLVSEAHRYMRGARSSARVFSPLDSISKAVEEIDGNQSSLGNSKQDVGRLIVDAQAMAKLVHEVVPHR
jgi:hypothetical protein